MNSYNHYAFGAIVGFFYRRLAGIAPAAPGFRRIAARPLWLPAIGRVSASYDSLVGTIATETDGDAEGLKRFALSIPANTVAEVELPSGEWRARDGAVQVGEDGPVRFELPAGDHEFRR
ncbi:alpha-L-rhamnosidase C-terminal domain-containing protein [Sphingomonas humi]